MDVFKSSPCWKLRLATSIIAYRIGRGQYSKTSRALRRKKGCWWHVTKIDVIRINHHVSFVSPTRSQLDHPAWGERWVIIVEWWYIIASAYSSAWGIYPTARSHGHSNLWTILRVRRLWSRASKSTGNEKRPSAMSCKWFDLDLISAYKGNSYTVTVISSLSLKDFENIKPNLSYALLWTVALKLAVTT